MPDLPALTVTQAMTRARSALETVSVQVIGEVSEFNDKPGYKAAYFTVCDEDAAMPCMMWRDAYSAAGVTLRSGMLVELHGAFSAYIPKGRMQFMVKRLSLAGEGTLRMQVAALSRKLENEGLMRADRKQTLPKFPARIGLVTSPRGKAVHDVIRTLRRRYPLAELLIAGVTVEGAGAPRAIADGMKAAVDAGCEVVLLVRGGGSYEDLMPFNHELVARTVAACPVPVVTGIGHEPDSSIADMVADVRASTPTAAAEAVAPSIEELQGRARGLSRAMASALTHTAESHAHRLRHVMDRPVFRDSTVLTGGAWQALDEVSQALRRAIPMRLERDGQTLRHLRDRLELLGPSITERAADAIELGAARLHGLSPLAVLGRGYSVCYAHDGRTIIRDATQSTVGEHVSVRLAHGRLGCIVEHQEREAGGDG